MQVLHDKVRLVLMVKAPVEWHQLHSNQLAVVDQDALTMLHSRRENSTYLHLVALLPKNSSAVTSESSVMMTVIVCYSACRNT